MYPPNNLLRELYFSDHDILEQCFKSAPQTMRPNCSVFYSSLQEALLIVSVMPSQRIIKYTLVPIEMGRDAVKINGIFSDRRSLEEAGKVLSARLVRR